MILTLSCLLVLPIFGHTQSNYNPPPPLESTIATTVDGKLPLITKTLLATNPSTNVCTTPGCVEAAAYILSTHEPKADPCNDFYQYACGKYLAKTLIPDDKSWTGTYIEVTEQVQTQLRILLEKNVPLSYDSVIVNMTRRLYAECKDTDKLSELKSDSLWQILQKLGGMPLLTPGWTADKFDYKKLLASVKGDYLIDPIFYLYVTVDDKNVSQNAMRIEEPTLKFESRDYYLNDTLYSSEMRAFKQLITDVTKLIALDANITILPNDYNAQVDAIVQFEKSLANLTLTNNEKRNSSKLYNKYSVGEVKKSFPEFDWNLYFAASLPKDVAKEFNDKTSMVVTVPRFMSEAGKLLQRTDFKTVANYLLWSVISAEMDRLDERFGDFQQSFDRVATGVSQKLPRWKKCIDQTKSALGIATGAIYIDQYFDVSERTEVVEMVKNILAAEKEMISDVDWMDSTTKSVALEKVDNMVTLLGYADFMKNGKTLDEYYKELSFSPADNYLTMRIKGDKFDTNKNLRELLRPVDRHRFEKNVALVNAYYDPLTNAIDFLAAVLQPPFFKSTYPKYINYGCMGSIIGHEVTHGFDDQGAQYDKNGQLKNWWTDESAKNFVDKVKCIIDQYSGYEVKDIKRKVDGVLTQGENVADNGGIKAALRAYKKYSASLGAVAEPTLPGLNFTNNQAFFMSYASFWCSKSKPEQELTGILTDSHSPNEFRVLGALSNTKEFAEAFNCPAKTIYNPEKRCQVW